MSGLHGLAGPGQAAGEVVFDAFVATRAATARPRSPASSPLRGESRRFRRGRGRGSSSSCWQYGLGPRGRWSRVRRGRRRGSPRRGRRPGLRVRVRGCVRGRCGGTVTPERCVRRWCARGVVGIPAQVGPVTRCGRCREHVRRRTRRQRSFGSVLVAGRCKLEEGQLRLRRCRGSNR